MMEHTEVEQPYFSIPATLVIVCQFKEDGLLTWESAVVTAAIASVNPGLWYIHAWPLSAANMPRVVRVYHAGNLVYDWERDPKPRGRLLWDA